MDKLLCHFIFEDQISFPVTQTLSLWQKYDNFCETDFADSEHLLWYSHIIGNWSSDLCISSL